jgi:RNA polymerase sigma-70 factor (ECF subfamily)
VGEGEQVSGPSDEELLAALRGGDTDSLGVLVMRWQRPLYRFVYRMLPRPEDARDVCQETFLRVLKKADRFKPGARFSTWMYQIALNLCRDHARRRRRWGLILSEGREIDDRLEPAPQGGSSGADPTAYVDRRERSEALGLALQEIPAEQREVLILKEFEGLKFCEIAEILGCPESTIKSRMYYGLSGLKSALVRHGITRA